MHHIYKITPTLGAKFSTGIVVEVKSSAETRAVVRMKFSPRAYEQFGAYRMACTDLSCQSARGGLMVLPRQVHGLPPATITDLSCMVNGDEWCTYDITWQQPESQRPLFHSIRRLFTGSAR